MFVRFVAGTEAENAYWLTGIFTIARVLRDDGRLYRYESELLEEIFAWFNCQLPCPPFGEKLRSGEWTQDAVAWFRDDAVESLRRMWELVAILEEYGEPVRLVRSDRPGKIVYADRFQIVAETPYWV